MGNTRREGKFHQARAGHVVTVTSKARMRYFIETPVSAAAS